VLFIRDGVVEFIERYRAWVGLNFKHLPTRSRFVKLIGLGKAAASCYPAYSALKVGQIVARQFFGPAGFRLDQDILPSASWHAPGLRESKKTLRRRTQCAS
jgi:hypothetical protein